MKRLTQPIKWHGGKHYLAHRIIEEMEPHIHYVEPYAGGLSVLLAKNPLGVSEVVNDLDGDLTNFWRVLQGGESFGEFRRVIEAMPFSQAEFHDADLPTADPIQRAVNFFVRCRQSRQGLRKEFATMSRRRTRRGMNEQVSAWLTSIEGLHDIHSRLKRVVIFNEDAVKLIKSQDSSTSTLFYCDPPYLHYTRTVQAAYKHEMSTYDHEELIGALLNVKGKVILSGYPNMLYDTSLRGWRTVDIAIDNKASSAKKKEIKTERLWMNY